MTAEHQPTTVTDENSLQATLSYVADKAVSLGGLVTNRVLPVDTLTLFARSDSEYEVIEKLIKEKGSVSALSHGPTLYIETDQRINDQHVKLLGVRHPDDSRPERGYGDYPVADFEALKIALSGSDHATQIVSGNGIELIELRHPDFDVRGYIVRQ